MLFRHFNTIWNNLSLPFQPLHATRLDILTSLSILYVIMMLYGNSSLMLFIFAIGKQRTVRSCMAWPVNMTIKGRLLQSLPAVDKVSYQPVTENSFDDLS